MFPLAQLFGFRMHQCPHVMKVASMYVAIDATCLYTGNKSCPFRVLAKILRCDKPYRFRVVLELMKEVGI